MKNRITDLWFWPQDVQEAFVAIIILGTVGMLGLSIVSASNISQITGTVIYLPVEEGHTAVHVRPEGMPSSGEKDVLLINKDSLFNFKFNSRDIILRVKQGERYSFTCAGFRIPFLSMSKNILEVEKSVE